MILPKELISIHTEELKMLFLGKRITLITLSNKLLGKKVFTKVKCMFTKSRIFTHRAELCTNYGFTCAEIIVNFCLNSR